MKKMKNTNKTKTVNGYFAIMTDFNIKYRLGEGTKIREYLVQGVKDRKEASLKFNDETPDNSILVEIEEVNEPIKSSERVHRRMIINNDFDQFILDQLQQKELTNNDLIDYIGVNRNTWGRLRRNPEKLYFYDLCRICEFLDVPMETLTAILSKVVQENIKQGTLNPSRKIS